MRRRDDWRTSSYSQPNGNCVALNGNLDAARDTKNGVVLRLNRRAITELLATTKSHQTLR